jgi:trimethylamine corrinoid protein
MILEDLKQAIMDGDTDQVKELCQKVLDEHLDPVEAVEQGLIKGIEEIGRLWTEGEMFLPDVMMGADALKVGLEILGAELSKAKAAAGNTERRCKIVIGTVKGDIHDIGKNIVSAMMTAASFDVYDIGYDQGAEVFAAKAEEIGADIIGASALLTTTMGEQKELIEYLKSKGLRSKYRVIIGGGPTTQGWADEIGADGWAETANDAVTLCHKLVG